MQIEDVQTWVHERLVMTFAKDTLKTRKDTILGRDYYIVQIFRHVDTVTDTDGKVKPVMVEVGGVQFEADMIERDPAALEFRLAVESRRIANETTGNPFYTPSPDVT